MPPLDLVLCDGDGDGGGAELKAACGYETALPGPDDDEDDPYAPAESLRLRIGEDIDWSDLVVVGAVAAVLERDDSTKDAGANPKCAARRSVAAARTSTMSAAPPAPRAVAVVIGGLPGKKVAREHGGRAARVFASWEAAEHRLPEPGSPKVSCLGGVRSQPRHEAVVVSGGRRWWSWLVADVMSCCWNGNGNGRRDRRPGAGEADIHGHGTAAWRRPRRRHCAAAVC